MVVAKNEKKKVDESGIPTLSGAEMQRWNPEELPKLSKAEVRKDAEQRLLNFLDILHKGQGLPPEMKEELLSEAENIYSESLKNAKERFKFATDRGAVPSRGEKITIWQNEFRKSMLVRLEKLVEPIAQKRVDQVIASLPEKDRKSIMEQRADYVKRMQRQLALNPRFLKEKSSAADQKKQLMAMISNLEEERDALTEQVKILKKRGKLLDNPFKQ
ncbi:MAG: hypothetical protein GY852_11595 [bacterium]|nr:hypothetical protein [bacterium]